jgi:hypothetical protein
LLGGELALKADALFLGKGLNSHGSTPPNEDVTELDGADDTREGDTEVVGCVRRVVARGQHTIVDEDDVPRPSADERITSHARVSVPTALPLTTKSTPMPAGTAIGVVDTA